jgi:hypothetical protein
MRFPAPSSSSQSSTFPAASHRSDKVELGAGPRNDNPPEDAEDRRKNPDVSAVHEAQGIKQGQGQDLTSASFTSSVVGFLAPRGLLGPCAGARFGLLTCGGDQNNGTVRLAAAVATNPRNPVRSTGLAVHLIRCRGHELRNLPDFGHICIASASTIS